MGQADSELGDGAQAGPHDGGQAKYCGPDSGCLDREGVQVGEDVVQGVLQVGEDVPAGERLQLGSYLRQRGLGQAHVDVHVAGPSGQPLQVEAGLAVVQVRVDGGLAVELVELVLQLLLGCLRQVGVSLDVSAEELELPLNALTSSVGELGVGLELGVDSGDLLPDLELGRLLQVGVHLDVRLDVGDALLDLCDVLAVDLDLGVDGGLGLADRLKGLALGGLVKVNACLDRGLHLVELAPHLGHGVVVQDRPDRRAPVGLAELLLDLLQVSLGDVDVRGRLGLRDGRLDAAQVLGVYPSVDLKHEAVERVLDGVAHLTGPLLGSALDALADLLKALLDPALSVTPEVACVSADLYDYLADLVCHGLPSPLVRRAGGIAARLLSEAMIPPA